MREVRHAACPDDPFRGLREAAPFPLELRRIPLDPDSEHVPVAVFGQQAVQLDTGQNEEAGGRRSLAPMPVIGERDDVVARAPVVLRDPTR
jgi:hypothetical protein